MLNPASFRSGALAIAWVCLCSVANGAELAATASHRRTPIVIAVEQARASVVNIHGRKTVRSDEPDVSRQSDPFKQVNGMGTGIVIDERGYIVTNYHVVEGVRRIQVTTAEYEADDGRVIPSRTLTGRLIAHDPATDLAVIKIDRAGPLPVISIGTSSDLMAGETVVAIGNAYGYEHTVTRGIISALHRPVQVSVRQKYTDLIQTDASINPGNSGGPLLNLDGEVIGINVAVRVGAQGIGFAVPIDHAIDVVSRLLDAEVSRSVIHGLVGKTVTAANRSHFVVTSVAGGSPAQDAGLRSGDVITGASNIDIRRSLDFERALLGRQAGEQIVLDVENGGGRRSINLILSEAAHRPQGKSISSHAWSVLGVRLMPISERVFRQASSRYGGGLKVVAVRSDGPAAKEGIRNGDILVGLHKWETVSLDNIAYILESDEFRRAQPIKFYILRGGETRFGHLQANVIGD